MTMTPSLKELLSVFQRWLYLPDPGPVLVTMAAVGMIVFVNSNAVLRRQTSFGPGYPAAEQPTTMHCNASVPLNRDKCVR